MEGSQKQNGTKPWYVIDGMFLEIASVLLPYYSLHTFSIAGQKSSRAQTGYTVWTMWAMVKYLTWESKIEYQAL
jgi:hypothetical protein